MDRMDRKIRFGGFFGASILLVLMVMGFQRELRAQGASNGPTDAASTTKQHWVETYGKLPLTFEANAGQTNRQVEFLSRGQGYTLFLTRRAEAVLVLGKSAPKRTAAQSADRLADVVKSQPDSNPPAVLRMKLVGAKRTPQVEGVEELPGKANYFIGNDPKKWRTNVPTYAKVRYREVYPGVDLVYYGNQRQLEHDFTVAPGADPAAIKITVEGAERLSFSAQGDLVVRMKAGEVRLQKPVMYQEVEGGRREISGSYRLKDAHQVGFQVAAYDENRPLIIDPVLAYSTYLGGVDYDLGTGIAVDSNGNAYVTGFTLSLDFPTKNPPTGACQVPCGVNGDAFVTKLNSTGSALVYSTYLGGSDIDQGFGIAVDFDGNAYITGMTHSSDFPRMNPIKGACRGDCGNGLSFDAFVTKLNTTGSALIYSSYLGGDDADSGRGIAVDATGHAYVTGITDPDFPTTMGALQTLPPNGESAAFVAKLNPSGSALDYSTYLGGSSWDQGLAIAIDSGGNAYITGVTQSADFPRMNAAQPSLGAASADNAFVTKLNVDGSALVYSTYLGGSAFDAGYGIAVDSGGNAYVTGVSASDDFPATGRLGPGGAEDAFVTKLNPAGAFVYSTFVGGGFFDSGNGIAVDAGGNVFVTGITYSSDFPTTANAIQPASGGSPDAFVATINAGGTALLYSTYLGGNEYDQGNGIAVDSGGNAYVTGITYSNNFPVAGSPPIQSSNGGGGGPVCPIFLPECADAFVAKISNITCKPEKDDVEGDGHENGDDGHEGKVHFCKSSSEMDFEEPDTGKGMKGHMDAVTFSGANQAIITGSGTLADGTPVNYTAVVLGNQPVIGANHFAISWVTATGSVFQTSGALTDGFIVVQPQ